MKGNKGAMRKDLWPMRLNKYIAYAGICSRRKAEELVKRGQIKVNDVIVKIPFIEITQNDTVKFKDQIITPTKKFVYILLNKPKNYISTVSDEKNRNSILDLIKENSAERLYPVGRLDRNTTGLILLTNDGHLAQKLSHPRNSVSKIYKVWLDKKTTQEILIKFQKGAQLEDGYLKPDALNYSEINDPREVLIEIHSGKNRVVRRYFEHFGFTVEKLDRVYYAGLTKKNISRGRYRHLTPDEVRNLKHLGK